MAMHRALRSFWGLTATTVFSAGLVSQTLAARPGPGTDLLLGLSALILVVSAALLVRVTRYLSGAGRAARVPLRNARAGRSRRPLP